MKEKLAILLILFMIIITFIMMVIRYSEKPNKNYRNLDIERLYVVNSDLYKEVKDILKDKLVELDIDYLTINYSGNYRIYISKSNDGTIIMNKTIENLDKLFKEDEILMIEEVFDDGFVYIDSRYNSCEFAEQGSLDSYNVIMFTTNPKALEKYVATNDDEIVTKLSNNWYIYGYR